ncbi:hypothetical protein QVD17_27714 [Tagetes erecta]|uniref:protein-serine/threonine phosphatase n=1 Tax=Tagetes erecta TaxID=13708 RepID=A0AAD8K917_TARER|nr:hypothetical protein QVD17_27714 [Tagetes erecta]
MSILYVSSSHLPSHLHFKSHKSSSFSINKHTHTHFLHFLLLQLQMQMDTDDADLNHVDSSELSSTSSTVSSIFSTSDVDFSSNFSITSSSSGEISAAPVVSLRLSTEQLRDDVGGVTSSSSGEVLAAAVVPLRLSTEQQHGETRRMNKCVGRNNKGVTWGFKSVIGRRKEMEDAVAVVPGFMSRTCHHVGGCTAHEGSRTSIEISPIHFFGVYDGHGGSQVAKFCAERLHEVIAEEWDQEANDDFKWQQRWEAVLSNSFEKADNEVITEAVAPEIVGTTAVTVVLSGCQIIVSNCGDSRAVLCRGTETIPLTVDQKPDREDELLRIEELDGKVINWNGARVFGVLAMSRAIGDHYLRPWIIPVPEITFTTRTDEDECLVIASDGLWDVMSNNEVGEMARRILRRRRRSMAGGEVTAAQTLADSLTEIAMGRNSSDNVSVIVVDLKSKKKQHNTMC